MRESKLMTPNPSRRGLPAIVRSDELYERARLRIPGATQTLAKGTGQHVRGVAPKFLSRGRGARVWDVDGNEFLDFTMAVGPLSLGYGNPTVDEAIRRQLADGISFSLPHALEVEVAEAVHRLVPGAEMVRFSKTGCDVTSAAVRVARAYTGRNRVLCCGYHGWHDWYIGVTDRDRGIPRDVAALTSTFNYNDLASVAEVLADSDHDVACVILEPVTFELPRENFLAELAALCRAHKVLLIFDEMWTGFRCSLGGAQQRFDVQADLACFSKAIANGMPLSVLTGRADVMQLFDRDVFFFTTFGGETLSLAAAQATMAVLEEKQVPSHLERLGLILQSEYRTLVRELGLDFTDCVGLGCRTMTTFAPRGLASGADPLLMKSLVQQELIRHGILWTGFHNLSLAHTEGDVAHLMSAYRAALEVLAKALARGDVRGALLGDPLEPVFRRTTGFNTRPAARNGGGLPVGSPAQGVSNGSR